MKPALKSRTIRFALFLLAVLAPVQAALPLFEVHLHGAWYALLTALIGVAVGVLRQMTTEPLGGASNAPPTD